MTQYQTNLQNYITTNIPPDFGQTFYLVDSNFRTAAQGWTTTDRTGPLDLYDQRNPGTVFYGAGVSGTTGISGSYGTDAAAAQAAINAMVDYRGDKLFLTPGSYSIGTALTLDCAGMRVVGPPIRNLRQSRVLVTDTIGLAFTVSATDVEVGYMTVVPLTATTFFSVANAANFGYLHDIYYNALGVTGSTSTIFLTSAATTIDWLVERCTFNVDAAQGPAFSCDSITRWIWQDCDFYVNITAIAWASVFTFTTSALGNIARRLYFRGCGGATPAVFTKIFTGIANVNGQLLVSDCRVDGTALATATDIENTFGTTTDIELIENYQSGDATTEGGVLVKLA